MSIKNPWSVKYNHLVKKIGEDIYVVNNFLDEDECDQYYGIVSSLPENRWHNKHSDNVNEVEGLRLKLRDFFIDEYMIGETLFFGRLKNGESHGRHSDNHDFLDLRKASESLKPGQKYNLVPNNIYGIVVYLNDFDGGELFYSYQNITYKPQKGDLVFHSAEDHCIHEVLNVKSEIRYVHPNFLFKYIKVPVTI